MKFRRFLKKEIVIFAAGLAMICYPAVSNYFESIERSNLITTYDSTSSNLSSTQKENMLNDAYRWNEELYLKQKGISVEGSLNYNDVLNIGNGIIGSVEIPQIKVNIPVYHGTEEAELNAGAGHVADSSLPVGGENTHTVITGHSGLPSSKLFTRLDELKQGEQFYIRVLDKTLAYKIDKIETVLPENAEYEIEDGKDLATLVTCTPFGLNTHRLMITGHRIPYNPEVKKQTDSKIPSYHEAAIYIIPALFITVGIIIFIKKKGARTDA